MESLLGFFFNSVERYRRFRNYAALAILPIIVVFAIPAFIRQHEQMKELVSRAAEMRIDDFRKISASGKTPKLSDFENQPLTLVVQTSEFLDLLAQHPTSNFDYKVAEIEDFESAITAGEPAWPASVNVLQLDYITGFEFSEKDGRVRGEVSFEAPGVYSGKLHYLAERIGTGYRITQFRFPELRIERGKTGRWKVIGIGG